MLPIVYRVASKGVLRQHTFRHVQTSASRHYTTQRVQDGQLDMYAKRLGGQAVT